VYSKDVELDVMVFEEGFDEVAKPEELKDGDPGIDGDVEDFEEEETEKGVVAEKPKDKVAVKEESSIGGKSKDAEGEETQRTVRANTDWLTLASGEKIALEINKADSILSAEVGGAALWRRMMAKATKEETKDKMKSMRIMIVLRSLCSGQGPAVRCS
jgi:hypothetical protein